MKAPRYRVTLTRQERTQLEQLAGNPKTARQRFLHARALLLVDVADGGPGWKVADVAQALGITSRTIEHIKERFVEEGVEAALDRKPHEGPPRLVFDGRFEARLTALACSEAPSGYSRWTIRLLAEKVVALDIAPQVSTMTIHRVLKKTNLSLT
jgi:transposase